MFAYARLYISIALILDRRERPGLFDPILMVRSVMNAHYESLSDYDRASEAVNNLSALANLI